MELCGGIKMTEEIKEILYCDIYNDLDDKKYEKLLNYITNLQKENELHNKILKDANDVLNIQTQKGNYNYDSYMLGLYNGMEMIVSLFEQREPNLKSGKDINFLHEIDYKQRNEKAIEWLEKHIKMINGLAGDNDGLKGSIVLSDDVVVNSLLYILKGGGEN